MASKTTAAGSEPSAWLIISTWALLPHSFNWSIAAALKVSAAQTRTDLPSLLNLDESLPIVVVLPTPFTPTTKMITGGSVLIGVFNSL